MTWRFWRVMAPPHRQDVRDRLRRLPPLPEAARMRHGPRVSKKPTTLAEWKRKHSA